MLAKHEIAALRKAGLPGKYINRRLADCDGGNKVSQVLRRPGFLKALAHGEAGLAICSVNPGSSEDLAFLAGRGAMLGGVSCAFTTVSCLLQADCRRELLATSASVLVIARFISGEGCPLVSRETWTVSEFIHDWLSAGGGLIFGVYGKELHTPLVEWLGKQLAQRVSALPVEAVMV